MNEIYLVNHRPASYRPFKSIMRLPKEEAFALAAKLSEDKTCEANSRFSNASFAEYYATRLEAEKWLYNNFVKLGGKPQTKHPLYFYVHGWNLTPQFWPENITEKILLTDIEPCHISFMFDDSCGVPNNPEKYRLFMKDELMELISLHSGIGNLLEHVKQQIGHGMIEAHLWSDKYVLKENGQ